MVRICLNTKTPQSTRDNTPLSGVGFGEYCAFNGSYCPSVANNNPPKAPQSLHRLGLDSAGHRFDEESSLTILLF